MKQSEINKHLDLLAEYDVTMKLYGSTIDMYFRDIAGLTAHMTADRIDKSLSVTYWDIFDRQTNQGEYINLTPTQSNKLFSYLTDKYFQIGV